jgi:hypothetical protein
VDFHPMMRLLLSMACAEENGSVDVDVAVDVDVVVVPRWIVSKRHNHNNNLQKFKDRGRQQ